MWHLECQAARGTSDRPLREQGFAGLVETIRKACTARRKQAAPQTARDFKSNLKGLELLLHFIKVMTNEGKKHTLPELS